MQQRTMGSSRGPDWDDSFIDVEAQPEAKQSQSSWRRRMENINLHGLPISDRDPHNIGKRETAKSRFAENWLHVIPLFVLLCFFILWWFSYPVHLVIKDESVAAIHRIEISRELNETRMDLALLASASSPGAGAWSFQKFIRTDVTETPNTNQSGFGDQQQKSHALTHRVEISRGFNDTLVDPALPALAALPRASNFRNFTRTTETEAPKANRRYLL
ncbi:uncharacterized protein LOC115752221 [Rhodamnia argentea]|uniref:Uncharacterized protein LOC115752221 n=1 Tax=Rhodamnia argentea TaxID=178133 RepID=A0A8B8QG80_9MYRT|nr:uncharacterized protein LOC115752221 [Rhodamnia argentea]